MKDPHKVKPFLCVCARRKILGTLINYLSLWGFKNRTKRKALKFYYEIFNNLCIPDIKRTYKKYELQDNNKSSFNT